MKITERRLRQIIRSVIKESTQFHDEFDESQLDFSDDPKPVRDQYSPTEMGQVEFENDLFDWETRNNIKPGNVAGSYSKEDAKRLDQEREERARMRAERRPPAYRAKGHIPGIDY